MDKFNISNLEVAQTVGQPVDPRKPYPPIVEMLCETDYADPDEHKYYYDNLLETDKIISIAADGGLTSEAVTPDADAELTFVDVSTPEYYVSIPRLAAAKEKTLARKKSTIIRALDAKEINYLLTVLAAAVPSGNKFTLGSGVTTFNVNHLTQMVDAVADYGDNYVLLCSSVIWKDIILWNWNDNKNIDVFETFAKLGVKIQRIPNQTVTIDGSATDLITSTRAYLVALDTQSSIGKKPFLLVRRRLDDIKLLGGLISEAADAGKPERLIFVSPNPMNVGGTRYAAVGISGYEQIVCACVNIYALAQFTRS